MDDSQDPVTVRSLPPSFGDMGALTYFPATHRPSQSDSHTQSSFGQLHSARSLRSPKLHIISGTEKFPGQLHIRQNDDTDWLSKTARSAHESFLQNTFPEIAPAIPIIHDVYADEAYRNRDAQSLVPDTLPLVQRGVVFDARGSPVPILAMACGPSNELLRIVHLRNAPHMWRGKSSATDLHHWDVEPLQNHTRSCPSATTWSNDVTPITAIKFYYRQVSRRKAPISYLLIQKDSSTSFIEVQTCLPDANIDRACSCLASLDNPLPLSYAQTVRTHLLTMCTISASDTGGYCHTSASAWLGRQSQNTTFRLAVMDTCGYWTCWAIESNGSRELVNRGHVQYGILDVSSPLPPFPDSHYQFVVGWERSSNDALCPAPEYDPTFTMGRNDTHISIVWSDRALIAFSTVGDVSDNYRYLFKLYHSEHIVDVQPCPSRPFLLFVLTNFQLAILELIISPTTTAEPVPQIFRARVLSATLHMLDAGDRSLRLTIVPNNRATMATDDSTRESNVDLVLIYSQIDRLSLAYWYSYHESSVQSHIQPIVLQSPSPTIRDKRALGILLPLLLKWRVPDTQNQDEVEDTTAKATSTLRQDRGKDLYLSGTQFLQVICLTKEGEFTLWFWAITKPNAPPTIRLELPEKPAFWTGERAAFAPMPLSSRIQDFAGRRSLSRSTSPASSVQSDAEDFEYMREFSGFYKWLSPLFRPVTDKYSLEDLLLGVFDTAQFTLHDAQIRKHLPLTMLSQLALSEAKPGGLRLHSDAEWERRFLEVQQETPYDNFGFMFLDLRRWIVPDHQAQNSTSISSSRSLLTSIWSDKLPVGASDWNRLTREIALQEASRALVLSSVGLMTRRTAASTASLSSGLEDITIDEDDIYSTQIPFSSQFDDDSAYLTHPPSTPPEAMLPDSRSHPCANQENGVVARLSNYVQAIDTEKILRKTTPHPILAAWPEELGTSTDNYVSSQSRSLVQRQAARQEKRDRALAAKQRKSSRYHLAVQEEQLRRKQGHQLPSSSSLYPQPAQQQPLHSNFLQSSQTLFSQNIPAPRLPSPQRAMFKGGNHNINYQDSLVHDSLMDMDVSAVVDLPSSSPVRQEHGRLPSMRNQFPESSQMVKGPLSSQLKMSAFSLSQRPSTLTMSQPVAGAFGQRDGQVKRKKKKGGIK